MAAGAWQAILNALKCARHRVRQKSQNELAALRETPKEMPGGASITKKCVKPEQPVKLLEEPVKLEESMKLK